MRFFSLLPGLRRVSLAMFAVASGPAVAAESPVGRELLLTTQNWAPYIREENGRPTGLAVVPLDCAMSRLGQKYRIQFLPWLRAQNEVRHGRADGFLPASRNAERDGYAALSEPLVYNTWAWYFPKGSKIRPDAPGFKETAVVTSEAGSNLLAWLTEQGHKMAPAPDTHGQLAQMLVHRRIDAALATVAVFEAEATALGFDLAAFDRHVVREDPLGVYFSRFFLRENSHFLIQFNSAVRACR